MRAASLVLLPLACAFAGVTGVVGACIAPSVVAQDERAVRLESEDLAWRPAAEEDVPGRYVSTELTGPLAATLRMVVYLFEPDGSYAGAGLLDDAPPRFEVIGGRWSFGDGGFVLDGGEPARIETTDDGSLRLTGSEGSVVLRRERER